MVFIRKVIFTDFLKLLYLLLKFFPYYMHVIITIVPEDNEISWRHKSRSTGKYSKKKEQNAE